MQTLTMKVSGMSCGHCVAALRGSLEAVPGVLVEEVRVGGARVSYDPGVASADDLEQAVRNAGYQPVPED